MLLFFEGLDGCGKTTVLKEIKEFLTGYGRKVVDFRDPGGTPMAEEIRNIVKSARSSISPTTRFLLFTAARSELMYAIREAEDNNNIVLVDRWWFSTFAYQGADGIAHETILNLTRELTNLSYDPRLAFYFAATDEERAKRKRDRGDTPTKKGTGDKPVHKDHYEAKGRAFDHAVERHYRALVKKRYLTRIDANKSLPEVVEAVVSVLTPFLEEQTAYLPRSLNELALAQSIATEERVLSRYTLE